LGKISANEKVENLKKEKLLKVKWKWWSRSGFHRMLRQLMQESLTSITLYDR